MTSYTSRGNRYTEDGWHHTTITEAVQSASKSGSGEVVKIRFVDDDGRSAWAFFNVVNDSYAAMDIGRKRLASLLSNVSGPCSIDNLRPAIGRSVRIRVLAKGREYARAVEWASVRSAV